MNDKRTCDLLIKNGIVLTVDAGGSVYWPGAVAIDGGRIAAVGLDADVGNAFDARKVIDAQGGVVHPGFVDAHVHATLHTTRGALPDTLAAADYFESYVRWFNALNDEDEEASAQLACMEMLHNGVTCFMEAGTAFEPGAVAAAAERIGVRASVTDPFVWDRPDRGLSSKIRRAPPTKARVNQVLGREVQRNRSADALVRGHVGIYGEGTCSPALQKEAKAVADETGAVLSQHQSMDAAAVKQDLNDYGKPPLVYLHELGVVDHNTNWVHMNVLTEDEIAVLQHAGAVVVWNPGNFLNYSVGMQHGCVVPRMKRAGIPLAFGTDVAKVWGFAEQAFIGYLTVREHGDLIHADRLLWMSTMGGAHAMGLAADIGSLEPGKRADVVIRRANTPFSSPGIDPVREVVLVAKGRGVRTVLVNGQVVLDNDRLENVAEDTIYRRAHLSARRLLTAINY